MRIEKEYFFADDGVELFGLLHTTEEKLEKEVIIATHGMGSNCSKKRDDIIAHKATENGISYFTYNNRGSGLINSLHKGKDKILQGTAFEDVEDSYYDIVSAIKHMVKLGYEKIHLQGHSLGSTKTVYTYNKLIENNEIELLNKIKSVILLSLVDVVEIMSYLINIGDNQDIVKLALEKELKGNTDYIIDCKAPFLPLVSTKTFLKYYRNNENIDFAKYTTKEFEFEKINNIKVPIFMRWGNVNELISIPADRLAELMNEKIVNDKKDISYIDGATHNYRGKESQLAEEILEFVKQVSK
jgi:alpha-beta hydrolase superfamily lysophospholipase